MIRRIRKRGTKADPLRGLFEATNGGLPAVVEYEPDADLRDTEQVSLQEDGGIERCLHREVLPYAADAWYRPERVKVGYEISFNRYFYKPEPLRSLKEIRADILALEQETAGLLDGLVADTRAPYVVGTPRIYVDTSVVGGCKDAEFREHSRRLFESFRTGDATMLLSDVTTEELLRAPAAVRAIVDHVPEEHIERLPFTSEAERLAIAYLEAGALALSSQTDARHIAVATLAGADFLASWNFRHMVNPTRIRAYNEVNGRLGHTRIDIYTPQEINHAQ